MKKEELRQEAIKKVIQVLKDGYTDDYSNLDEIFAWDYYTDDNEKAKEILLDYGIFDAIKEVEDYEINRFGEIEMEFSNPKNLLFRLFYAIGSTIIKQSSIIQKVHCKKADEKTNKKIIEEFENL